VPAGPGAAASRRARPRASRALGGLPFGWMTINWLAASRFEPARRPAAGSQRIREAKVSAASASLRAMAVGPDENARASRGWRGPPFVRSGTAVHSFRMLQVRRNPGPHPQQRPAGLPAAISSSLRPAGLSSAASLSPAAELKRDQQRAPAPRSQPLAPLAPVRRGPAGPGGPPGLAAVPTMSRDGAAQSRPGLLLRAECTQSAAAHES
jgi:hypothetical protein